MRKKLLQKNAFTLMEMLIAIAIVVILLAVSIPTITKSSSDLQMQELDNYAKTIYLEAQNQLLTKRAEGGLPAFAEYIENNYSLQKVSTKPQDFDESANGTGWTQLYYVYSDDAIFKELVPAGGELGGSFLIELNPSTGAIYGVFYKEDGDSIDYSDVEDLGRGVADRKASGIGYYGGGVLESVVQEYFNLEQNVRVENGAELYVVVSFKSGTAFNKYFKEALSVNIEIKDEHGNTWDRTVEKDQLDLKQVGLRKELYVLLDSMLENCTRATCTLETCTHETCTPETCCFESHYCFDALAGDLVPGDNLFIEVTSTFNNGTINQTDTQSVQTNSLFKGINRGLTAPNGETYDEIYVSSLRHLRNLDEAYYRHSGNKPRIVQSKDIDFRAGNYAWGVDNINNVPVYVGYSSGPLEFFEPIENSTIFERTGAEYNGNGNLLNNFVIKASGDYVGIIKKTNGMIISKVNVQDISVDAGSSNYVGAFAGSITGGSVSESSVYLSTELEDGTHYSRLADSTGAYSNEMERRYNVSNTVVGGEYTGGFCGIATGTSFDKCFTAIKVAGTNKLGGFCGETQNGTKFTNCYTSGKIYADGHAGSVGGMVGTVSGTTFNNCYSTCVIAARTKAGGIAGVSKNSRYTLCNSYAKVTALDGTGIPSESGGFLGSGNSTNDTFNNCEVMAQDTYAGEDKSGIMMYQFDDFVAVTPNDPSKTHPYGRELEGRAFPFETVIDGTHYGNWPERYVIDTSLVYYEVYQDGTYGYYCVTTLANTNDGEESGYTWVLDTLQDAIVVEDGYGLLTGYNLSSFDYVLNIASVTPADNKIVKDENGNQIKDEHGNPVTLYQHNTLQGTLYTSDEHGTGLDENGDGVAKFLRQQYHLTFKGYEGIDFSPETDFDGLPVKNTFTIAGLYLYQLPYELQASDRSYVNKFYDRLVISNGCTDDEDPETPPVVVLKDTFTFYYCPHFARTAVNPAFAEKRSPINPEEVYIRSAKQLNALGRFTYYWNTGLGYSDKINFVQETDISFSDYVDTYCGLSFDLMDTSTSNPVRNRPIGQPISTTFREFLAWLFGLEQEKTKGQFNNNYDGRGKQIIDYRLASDLQFVGLFGEIERSTIQNVVMTVSEPYNPSDSNSKGGYIHGTYNGDEVTAIGCMMGISYHRDNTIFNCATSGYEVKYISSERPKLEGTCIGGLVGLSMSDINQCSACCDLRVEIPDLENSLAAINMGGLAGSQYYNGITRSYAGGTIDVSIANNNDIGRIKGIAAGGIAGALLIIPNDTIAWFFGITVDKPEYTNCYSYTRVLIDSKFNNVSGNTLYIAPIAVKAKFTTSLLDSILNLLQDVSTSNINVKDSYYLDTAFNGIQDAGEPNKERKYTNAYGATAKSYVDLWDARGVMGFGAVRDSHHTFAISPDLQGRKFNLPAIVQDVEGQYVHYGDWPHHSNTTGKEVVREYVGYCEKYVDTSVFEGYSIGLYYIDYNGNIISTLRDDLEIEEAAYVSIRKSDNNPSINNLGYVEINDILYYVYNEEDNIRMDHGQVSFRRTFTYELVELDDEGAETAIGSKEITFYTNKFFGVAISKNSNLGTEANPLQIRTPKQLQEVSHVRGSNGTPVYMQLSRDVDLAGMTNSVKVNPYCDFSGNGYVMANANVVVFDSNAGTIRDVKASGGKNVFIGTNEGTVKNCVIVNSTSAGAGFVSTNKGTVTNSSVTDSTSSGAGFVGTNEGTVTNCHVVNSTSKKSGFVGTNNGTIESCGVYAATGYAGSCVDGTSVSGTNVAGFVSENKGTIKNCQIAGAVKASGDAAGFVGTNANSGIIENCGVREGSYEGITCAAFIVTGNNAAGFALTNQGSITDCNITGTVNGVHQAAGFMHTNEKTVQKCHVINATINGNNQAAGFTINNRNGGGISNCSVYMTNKSYSGITVDGKQAVGFVSENTGNIDSCFATGSVLGDELAAGFVKTHKNAFVISNCYASCDVVTAGDAYGFVAENSATIKNCYSAGTVSSTATGTGHVVYGFGHNGANSSDIIENCYSICGLESSDATLYGFSDRGNVTNCYWGYSKNLNKFTHKEVVAGAKGTMITLKDFVAMTKDAGLGNLKADATADVPYTTSETAYPYPGIVSTDAANPYLHYGDWPKAEGYIIKNNYIINDDDIYRGETKDYAGIFYYEKYDDLTYGVYGIGHKESHVKTLERDAEGYVKYLGDAKVVFNTLAEGYDQILESGYGVFYSIDATDGIVTVDNWRYAGNGISEKGLSSVGNTDVSGYLSNNKNGIDENRYMLRSIETKSGEDASAEKAGTLSYYVADTLTGSTKSRSEILAKVSEKTGIAVADIPNNVGADTPIVAQIGDTNTYNYYYQVAFSKGAGRYDIYLDAHDGTVYNYYSYEVTTAEPQAGAAKLTEEQCKAKVKSADGISRDSDIKNFNRQEYTGAAGDVYKVTFDRQNYLLGFIPTGTTAVTHLMDAYTGNYLQSWTISGKTYKEADLKGRFYMVISGSGTNRSFELYDAFSKEKKISLTGTTAFTGNVEVLAGQYKVTAKNTNAEYTYIINASSNQEILKQEIERTETGTAPVHTYTKVYNKLDLSLSKNSVSRPEYE